MISLLALVLGTAQVAVEAAPGQQCPNPDQVTAALASHAVTSSSSPLRLRVDGKPGAPTIHLLNSEGSEILSRDLHSPAGPDDCVALADTVALIVERYLDEVEMRRLEASTTVLPSNQVVAMASPEVERTWAVGLQLLGRTGREQLISPGAQLWASRLVVLKGTRWTLGAAVGGLLPASSNAANDSVQVELLETWLAVRGGPWVELGQHFLGLQAEIGAGPIRGSRSADGAPKRTAWGWSPWMGVSAHYRHGLGQRLFVEASLGGALSVVRHEVVVAYLPEETRRVVATTPRFFTDLGLSLGFQF